MPDPKMPPGQSFSSFGRINYVRTVTDWEERLHLFLKDVIYAPHQEPEICESLIQYVQGLIKTERERCLQKALEVVSRRLGNGGTL